MTARTSTEAQDYGTELAHSRRAAFRSRWRSAVAVTASTSLASSALAFLSSPLLARAVGAKGRGDVAAVMVTLTMLSWVGYAGTPQAAGFFSTHGRAFAVGLMGSVATALGIVTGVALWLLAPDFASGHSHTTIAALRAGSLLLPLAGIAQCGLEIAYAKGHSRIWNTLRAIPVAGPALGVILLATFGRLDLTSALTVNVGALALWCFLSSPIALKHWAWKRTTSDPGIGSIARYAVQRWLGLSSQGLLLRLDQLLMVPFSAPAELGRYAVCVTVCSSTNLLSTAIGVSAYPQSRASAPAAALTHWRTARRRLLWCSLAAGTVIVTIGPHAVSILFGRDFSGLLWVLALLSVAQMFTDLWTLDANVLHGAGLPGHTVLPSWLATAIASTTLLILSRSGISALDAAAVSCGAAAVPLITLRARSGGVRRLLTDNHLQLTGATP